MAYKIAVGSSDGINVDLKFGEVTKFLIYEVDEEIKKVEEREAAPESDSETAALAAENKTKPGNESGDRNQGCMGAENGCGGNSEGCGGSGGGCGGPSSVSAKVELISDCRCVVCKKIGFQAQKQFEKKAISVFDVECSIKEALDKISFYYSRVDRHESLRK